VPIDGKACRGEVQPEHDHLLGLGEDRLRNGEAERARSLLVDDQPEFGRLFDLPARRDAMMLAKLHRAGELTAIWIPDAAHEAMRDLVRARATAGRLLSKARQHLQGFLLGHDRIYRGARAWTLAYRR
jgi:hypothetical protein